MMAELGWFTLWTVGVMVLGLSIDVLLVLWLRHDW